MNVHGVNNQINSLSQSSPQVVDSRSNSGQQDSTYEKSITTEKDMTKDKKETEKKNEIDEKEIIDGIEKANKTFQGYDKEFQYSVHEVTKQIMVKVVDRQSGKVINEIPPEKILDMVAKMWETAGLLVDEKR